MYDTRSMQLNDTQIMVSQINIPVYVAEAKDVCQEAYEGGIIWPQTKKVLRYFRPCFFPTRYLLS